MKRLKRRQMQLVKTSADGNRPGRVSHIDQGWTSPLFERCAERQGRPFELARRERLEPVRALTFEGFDVEFTICDVNDIAPSAVADPVSAQHTPERRNVALQRLARPLGRPPIPHVLDQPVGHQRPVRRCKQTNENAAPPTSW